MTVITIDANRLKTIRKARKIGRPKLAKLAGISERQIAKIEAAESPELPEKTVDRFSQALQIPILALTGELPLIDEDLEPVSASKCSNGCCG